MHTSFVLLLFLFGTMLIEKTNQELSPYRDVSSNNDDADKILLSSIRPVRFFENEPVPLSSSLVDDLTTLASVVYVLTLFVIVFILLAWITHYNAPCSSMVTSLVSTVTGLPEPIIHSVAFCGSCCLWCEGTWLFRRVHHFNLWMSNRVTRLVSRTCKMFFDRICPCCQPPDTPTNRSIIGKRSFFDSLHASSFARLGSLPAGLISMIHMSDHPSPPRVIVTGRDSMLFLFRSGKSLPEPVSVALYPQSPSMEKQSLRR